MTTAPQMLTASTTLMGSLEFWVLGCSVLFLSWIDHCTGVTLSPCGSDNTAEVVRGKTDNIFTCSGLGSGQKVEWRLLYQTSVYNAGSCPAVSSGGSCTRGAAGAAFTPSRTSSTESTLTVDATRLNNVVIIQLGTLKCEDPSNEASCQTDYVVTEDTTTGRAKAEPQSYFGVAVGLGVVLAVIVIFGVIVVVVSVLWLKRHHWILPCTDVDQLHRTSSKDLPTSERSRTITESCIQTEQMEGDAATRGPYDNLQMSDIGLRSVYSEIGHSEGRDTRSASGEAGGLYENTLR